MLKTSCYYRIDSNDFITEVVGNWSSLWNREENLLEQPLGRLIWDFIKCRSTKAIYKLLMKRVRTRGLIVNIPFRTYSDDIIQHMELKMLPAQLNGIWFHTNVVKTQKRNDDFSAEKQIASPKELIHICAWCNRVKANGEWLSIEEAIQVLGIFDKPKTPPITHGLCPDCKNNLQQDLKSIN